MDDNFHIHSEDREILRILYGLSSSVDIFYFHEKYRLSPGQVARVIRKYLADELIYYKDDKLLLSELGRRWLLKNRRQIFWGIADKKWKDIPKEFRVEVSNDHDTKLPSLRTIKKIVEKS